MIKRAIQKIDSIEGLRSMTTLTHLSRHKAEMTINEQKLFSLCHNSISMGEEKKLYDKIDRSILKAIPNPSPQAYEIKVKVPECTFLGVHEQPDFASIYLTFYPKKKIIELKSLKLYVYQLRDIVVSYERLINIIYNHLIEVYEPERLRIVMICNPRGGISSKLTIDSDWKVRGGEEKFKDWVGHEDTWDVVM